MITQMIIEKILKEYKSKDKIKLFTIKKKRPY